VALGILLKGQTVMELSSYGAMAFAFWLLAFDFDF